MIERGNLCVKGGGIFSKGHISVCPSRDTTRQYCKYRGQFTKKTKSKVKNISIVNIRNFKCEEKITPIEKVTITPKEKITKHRLGRRKSNILKFTLGCSLFLTEDQKRKILRNDNLPKVERETKQKKRAYNIFLRLIFLD